MGSDCPGANHSGNGIRRRTRRLDEPWRQGREQPREKWDDDDGRGKEGKRRNTEREREMPVLAGDLNHRSKQADESIEAIWINFETSSRYREYGGYSPEFRYHFCIVWVSSGLMMEAIDQVVEPHVFIH